MEAEQAPAAREGELELTPRPRIKKLSSAIVWIVAIFAVAVLWLVGYLVTTKAQHPGQDRRVASVTPPVDDLAERIKRAAEREAQISQQHAAEERARSLAPPQQLPPGFEELLGKAQQPGQRGLEGYERAHAGYEPLQANMQGDPRFQPGGGYAGGASNAPDGRTSTLERARASELIPSAFQSAAPRQTANRPQGDNGMPSPPDLASLRAQLLDTFQKKAGELTAAPAATPVSATAIAAAKTPGTLRPAGSPFRLSAGTLIPAVLTAGINSELPGQTTALVRRNVYDSRTGQYLLIPQGSRLVGEYDSRIAYGQKRVLVAWNRLIFPDGRSLDLAGMPAADLAAAAGLRDQVDNHFVRTFGSALLMAAVSAGVQLSQPERDGGFGTNPTPSQLAAAAVGQELGRVSSEYLRRNLDVRPTIEVRPGYELNVEVTADLDLEAPYDTAAAAF